MRLDHVGVVVKDLDEAVNQYQELLEFKDLSPVIDEPEQNVRIVFVRTKGAEGPDIELIQPLCEKSAVYNFLQKTGGGVHHVSYEVDDLDDSIEHFKKNKALPIGRIYPGAGHNGRRVIWFYTRLKELIELIEREK